MKRLLDFVVFESEEDFEERVTDRFFKEVEYYNDDGESWTDEELFDCEIDEEFYISSHMIEKVKASFPAYCWIDNSLEDCELLPRLKFHDRQLAEDTIRMRLSTMQAVLKQLQEA